MGFIKEVLNELSESRKLFHSEADFQHALAWHLKMYFGDEVKIRLEYPQPNTNDKIHHDIWLKFESADVGIELKYKTKEILYLKEKEVYNLKSHSAHDSGRYDYLQDVNRLQNAVDNGKCNQGFAIFLTNDAAYWKKQRSRSALDKDFRLTDGKQLKQGERLSWRELQDWIPKKRRQPIRIKRDFNLNWENYSEIDEAKYGIFRYLLLKIGRNE